jgi:hypothetical protein
VGRTSIAINAAVLTASIRVHADLKPDIGAVVMRDHLAGMVRKILRLGSPQGIEEIVVVFHLVELKLAMSRLESIGWVRQSAAAFWNGGIRDCHDAGALHHIRLGARSAAKCLVNALCILLYIRTNTKGDLGVAGNRPRLRS